jgi:O-antigen/teichoic acid export membrane protein
VSGKIIKSFAWDFAGRSGSQMASLVIGIILARILTPVEFGMIGMAMVFIAVSEIFTNLGLSSALIQRSDPTEEHFSSSFYLNTGVALALTILFIVLAPVIAGFFNNEEITGLIRVLSLSLLIGSFSVVQEARLRKKMRFDLLAKAKLISSVLSGVVGISMAFMGFGIWSLVTQTLVGRLLTTGYYWLVSTWRPKLLFKINAIKELWSYSFKLFISGIIDTVYNQLDSIIIAKIFSAEDLGLYSKAKSLNRFVIKYSSESIGSVTFPAMAAIQEKRQRMIELGIKAETLIAFVSFGLLGWLYVGAESLILTLIGPKWQAAIEIFRILCLSGFTYPLSAATLSMLKASGDSSSFLKVEVWKKIVGLAGLSIGFMFGLKGFLISLIVTGTIAVWMNMFVTGRSLNISVGHQLFPLVRYLIIAVVAAIITWFVPVGFKLNLLNFTIITVIFFSLYTGLNYLTRTTGMYLFNQQVTSLIKQLKLRFIR